MLFDFDDFDYDCDCEEELDGGEHYGCDLCECCEDCVYFADCDGCGNILSHAPLSHAPSGKVSAKKNAAAPHNKKAEKNPEPTMGGAKRPAQTKDWEGKPQRGAGVIWACLGGVVLALLIIGAILS